MQITWLEVMRLVRTMDAQRRAGNGIEPGDADQLLTMLLDFHGQAVGRRGLSLAPYTAPTADTGAAPEPRTDTRLGTRHC